MNDDRKAQLSWLFHVHGDVRTNDTHWTSIYGQLNGCRKLLTDLTKEYQEVREKLQNRINLAETALREEFPKGTAPTGEEIYQFVELLVLEKEGLDHLPFDRLVPIEKK